MEPMSYPQAAALFLWGLGVFLAIWAAFSSVRARNDVIHRYRTVLKSLDDVASLTDSVEVLRTAIKRIESRTNIRNKKAEADDELPDKLPDPRKDPEGWRKAMNLQIMKGRIQ